MSKQNRVKRRNSGICSGSDLLGSEFCCSYSRTGFWSDSQTLIGESGWTQVDRNKTSPYHRSISVVPLVPWFCWLWNKLVLDLFLKPLVLIPLVLEHLVLELLFLDMLVLDLLVLNPLVLDLLALDMLVLDLLVLDLLVLNPLVLDLLHE